MYQFDDVGSTFLSLPPNLQTTENDCFSYALDRQIAKMHRMAKQITVWSDLDSVDPKYYDFLAMTIRAPYYKSEYSNTVKLGLIKSTIMTRRYAGTARAIEELLSYTFPNAAFVPWYKYDGKPYRFKIAINEGMTEGAWTLFEMMLERVKAARSVLEEISVTHRIDQCLYAGSAKRSHMKNVIIDNSDRNYTLAQTGFVSVIGRQIFMKNVIIDGTQAKITTVLL